MSSARAASTIRFPCPEFKPIGSFRSITLQPYTFRKLSRRSLRAIRDATGQNRFQMPYYNVFRLFFVIYRSKCGRFSHVRLVELLPKKILSKNFPRRNSIVRRGRHSVGPTILVKTVFLDYRQERV